MLSIICFCIKLLSYHDGHYLNLVRPLILILLCCMVEFYHTCYRPLDKKIQEYVYFFSILGAKMFFHFGSKDFFSILGPKINVLQ